MKALLNKNVNPLDYEEIVIKGDEEILRGREDNAQKEYTLKSLKELQERDVISILCTDSWDLRISTPQATSSSIWRCKEVTGTPCLLAY